LLLGLASCLDDSDIDTLDWTDLSFSGSCELMCVENGAVKVTVRSIAFHCVIRHKHTMPPHRNHVIGPTPCPVALLASCCFEGLL
jgi:hypothetical protein